jgi:hypothetical protein
LKVAQLYPNRICIEHKNQPDVLEWLVCKHFLPAKNMINYYETLGGITFINRTIVCEDCYAKILTGEWKDLSATFDVLDEKSFRQIFSTLPFLNVNKDYFY